MKSVGVPVYIYRFAKRNRGINVRFGFRLGSAGGDLGTLQPHSVGNGGEFLVSGLGRNVGLAKSLVRFWRQTSRKRQLDARPTQSAP